MEVARLQDISLTPSSTRTVSTNSSSRALFGPPGDPANSSAPGPIPNESAFPTIVSAAEILTALEPYIRRVPEIESLNRQIAALSTPRTETVSQFRQRWNEIRNLQAKRKELNDTLVAAGRRATALPLRHRGTLPITGPVSAIIQPVAQGGRQIVETYVHPELLPKIQFKENSALRRPRYLDGVVYLRGSDGNSDAAHEIMHGIEVERPEILQKARNFLTHRAQGNAPVPLMQIYPNEGYRPDELTFEDDWTKRGGHAYTGKLYPSQGSVSPQDVTSTELLTEGLERLHRNPVLFASTDPEYFTFVINTIRNL